MLQFTLALEDAFFAFVAAIVGEGQKTNQFIYIIYINSNNRARANILERKVKV